MRPQPLAAAVGLPATTVTAHLARLELRRLVRRQGEVWSAVECVEPVVLPLPGEEVLRTIETMGPIGVAAISTWLAKPLQTVKCDVLRLHKRGVVCKAGRSRWALVVSRDAGTVEIEEPTGVRVLRAIAAGATSPSLIAQALDRAVGTVYKTITELRAAGKIERIKRGEWAVQTQQH